MPRLVMKFGGTSVADITRIKRAAQKIQKEVEAGYEIVVVVSAMSGETNRLIGLAESASALYDAREYDVIVAAGEQVTAGLMAIVLQGMGIGARSWMGWQIPITTNNRHGAARIEDINVDDLAQRLGEGEVGVVTGFQGLEPDRRRISTLGRGGSDTSAVALAHALKAERCDIYTDVDGVYTCDPRIVPKARKLDKITYEEMLEMASLGAKVLQTRSVGLAMKYHVRLQVLSSFDDIPGTLVVDEDQIVEKAIISGITYSRDEAKLTLLGVPDRPGVAANIFGSLAKAGINVDMIVQNISVEDGHTDLTFTLNRSDAEQARVLLESKRSSILFSKLVSDKDVAKISAVGVGMRTHAGVAEKMFQTLADRGINIQVISTSEIKISVLIQEEYTELALRALHTAFGLDQ